MILVQKPPQILCSPTSNHRRHPSAPVVVQATRTPGILSLSKPLRSTPPRQNQQQQPQKQVRTPKPKPASVQQRSPHLAHAEAQPASDSSKPAPSSKNSHENAAATSGNKTQSISASPFTPMPEKPIRGRQVKAPKDKTARRSTSQTPAHAHARRNNVRQPSPPITSQAEAIDPLSSQISQPPRNPASNSFDPFIVSSDSDSDHPRPAVVPLSKRVSMKTAPVLSSYPSGKLARRRNLVPQPPATPTPTSRAVPVPRVSGKSGHNVSRSAPINSTVHLRPEFRRTSAIFESDFPICDDMTDAEDRSPPSTPTRKHTAKFDPSWSMSTFDNGPRTAPLSKSTGFPFGATPSPVTRRRHRRAPSEGVFEMSFDEDFSSSSDASEELKKLFGLLPKREGSLGPGSTAKDKADFFASSMFQNSPSPDELPPPAF